MIYCFDIDECAADNSIRRTGAGRRPKMEDRKAYKRWLKELEQPGTFRLDKPIRVIKCLVDALKACGCIIYFITARSDVHSDETLAWLEFHGFNSRKSRVIFRKDSDERPAEEYKLEVLKQLEQQYLTKPALFDDNQKVCKLLAKHGFATLQVRT